MEQFFIKEQEITDEIITVTKTIGEIYRRLYFSRDNTKEYNLLVEQLKEYVKKEDELYESLNLTSEKAATLIDYLIVGERKEIEPGNNVLHSIYKNDYNDLFQYRIFNQMISLTFKNKKKYVQWLLDEGSFLDVCGAEGYYGFKMFERTISSDFDRNFLYLLNERLNDSCSEREKERLSKIKHNLLFISKDMENSLFEPNEKTDGIYYTFPFVGEFLGIDEVVCEDIQIEKSSAYVSQAMRGIFIKDDLVDDDVEISFEIFKMYMRTGFGLIYEVERCDELIELLQDEILETNEETNDRLSISTDVLLNEIDSIENEKPKCKYLHFALKK